MNDVITLLLYHICACLYSTSKENNNNIRIILDTIAERKKIKKEYSSLSIYKAGTYRMGKIK